MSRKADPTLWMWEQACDFIAEADRMHRQFFRLTTSLRSQALWEPPVDVFEDEREVVVTFKHHFADWQSLFFPFYPSS